MTTLQQTTSVLQLRAVGTEPDVIPPTARYEYPPDEATEGRFRAVIVDHDTRNALGDPEHITVTIQPGDHLNTHADPHAAAAPAGAERIAAERQRQIDMEGWTPEHDDQWNQGELVVAARTYALQGLRTAHSYPPVDQSVHGWPWHQDWWKPSDDPIRNLEKAGALIAAEIDRLQRALEDRG